MRDIADLPQFMRDDAHKPLILLGVMSRWRKKCSAIEELPAWCQLERLMRKAPNKVSKRFEDKAPTSRLA